MSTNSDVEQAWRARAASHGLTLLDEVRACPRSVLGQVCPVLVDDGYEPGDCGLCTHTVLDHRAMWTTAAGARVFTAEPYDVDPEALADFARRVEAIGLNVSVTGEGWWHPTTVRITVAPTGVHI